VARLPDNVSFEQAATLPVAGLTALRALQAGGSVLGKRVLITGATGGVGMLAVQMAAASGAHVTAVVSNEARFDEARSLGAHEVLAAWPEQGHEPFDLALEGVGGAGLVSTLHVMKAGGFVALYSSAGGPSELVLGDFRRRAGVRIVPFFLDNPPGWPIGEELGLMARLIGGGKLQPLIGLNRDWQQTPDVIRALAAREVRGKAVLSRSRPASYRSA
jgi:NADPH:quinone reductase-like Zn-dependent oxidoreductase